MKEQNSYVSPELTESGIEEESLLCASPQAGGIETVGYEVWTL